MFAESYQSPPKGNDWANPVRLRTMVRLLPKNVVKCSWPDTVENRRRTEFCQIYEGYPDVCRCEYKCKVCFHGKKETVKLEGGPREVASLAVRQLQRRVQCSGRLQRTEFSLFRTANRSCIIQILTPLTALGTTLSLCHNISFRTSGLLGCGPIRGIVVIRPDLICCNVAGPVFLISGKLMDQGEMREIVGYVLLPFCNIL